MSSCDSSSWKQKSLSVPILISATHVSRILDLNVHLHELNTFHASLEFIDPYISYKRSQVCRAK